MKLEVRNCGKQYGEQWALQDVNFTLTHGIYALLGPNGSGKSTLMNILCTLLEKTTGTLLWEDKEISTCENAYLQQLGYMPQTPCMYEDFTLFNFLSYMGVMRGMPKSFLHQRIEEVTKKVELTDALDKKIRAYSGGMKQRAMLCAALLHDPKILILDEPTAELDPLKRILVQKLLMEVSKDKMILIATHVVSDVEFIADQFLILKKGVLIEQGSRLALVKLLDGKVKEVKTTMEEYQSFKQQYAISSIRYEHEQLIARVLDLDDTLEGEVVTANINDVYLHLFGEKYAVL
ncbi:ABC transporter ATP-binding protein [Longicatena caecimuris]|uniref:ABC-2 type transport system ATP-binding protein n=1 Tax=Longicatena caecimuris TaxID=1796635 RepID=A0A4V2VIN6_9FIRM|nr:ATP-binding cassette domain-containing protein [Longicatena caecimuris]MCR1871388.1 ATP-binding cassette domain-containing protein [Longicatena caecimuris]MCU0103916.1 ATP-binding cassette domain-containing protein [Longicatena caecimuris]TCU52845.1 ABC-2 type transport system ATP-binding protein [Longicatena caecimuris]